MSIIPSETPDIQTTAGAELTDVPVPLANASDVAAFSKMLADDNRLLIIQALGAGEQSVLQLEAALPHTTQPNISRHLSQMKQAGMVQMRKDGKYSQWSLTDGYHDKVHALGVVFGQAAGLTEDQTIDRLQAKQNVEVEA